MPPDSGKEKGSARVASSSAVEPEPEGLKEGQEVVIVGLKAAQQVHNGEVGTITKAKIDKHKYEVTLTSDTQGQSPIKIKGADHLVR